jgi:hypothetical protein
MGKVTSACRILVVNFERKRSLRSKMYGNIILALILNKKEIMGWLDASSSV